MRQPTYQVHLSVYEGPLDLLLHLIEQEELDITTVSLAQVTDQYLAHLRLIEKVHPDELVDFMVVAARLLVIKSRALLPQPPKVIEEEEDVGDDLVRQLREYKLIKQAAQFLLQRDERGEHMFPRTVPASKQAHLWTPKLDLGGTSLEDLVNALQALFTQTTEEDIDLLVAPLAITIEHKIAQINARLQAGQPFAFHSLLGTVASREEVIVTLLAVLELIRLGYLSVRQEHLFGEIVIEPAAESDRPAHQEGEINSLTDPAP